MTRQKQLATGFRFSSSSFSPMLLGLRTPTRVSNPKPKALRFLSASLSHQAVDIAPPECSSPRSHHFPTLRALLEPVLTQNPPQILHFAPIFQLLTGRDCLKLGQQVHAQMTLRGLRPNASLGARIVAMYASSGDLESAALAFDRAIGSSYVLFNSMIRAYAKHGFHQKALGVYFRMRCSGFTGDHFTFPFVLKSCKDLNCVWIGRCVHGQIVKIGLEIDLYIGTSLIGMYVSSGDSCDAHNLFDEMPVRDVSSWNVLIAAHMKNTEVGAAEDLFRRMPCKNIVSWTAMISGYTQNGFFERALSLLDEMLEDGSEVEPNWVTIMSILPACAQSANLERGGRIQDFANSIGLGTNVSVQTALIAMYAKCGSLADARCCFDGIKFEERNLVAWNSMITAYSSHGCGVECVSTFEDMIRARVQPDAITFTALLSGCSHAGLVDVGLRYLKTMNKLYSVEPTVEHYACCTDLLARAGRLGEAKDLIDRLPMEAGPSIWGALLAASCKHQNLEITEMVARKLFVLEPENSGNYVLLANVYAQVGMWKELDELRATLKRQGVRKVPGCSWVEVNGRSHLFLGGDTSHPHTKEIYKLLEGLPQKIKMAG